MLAMAMMFLVARPPQDPIDNVIDPVPAPPVDRVLVFHMDEAILAEAALDGVERLTDPTHDFRNFIKGAMALAMLVAFIVGMYQGSIMRMMFAIGALGALWELGVKNRVPVRIDFYSPVMWYDYTTNYGAARIYHVPFLLAKILTFSSGVNGYVAEAMDHSAQVLMGTDYLVQRYAASVAEAIKTAAAAQYTDPKLRKAIAKFADHCAAPAISKLDPDELDRVGGQFRLVTAMLKTGGPLSDGKLVVVDDVFSNTDPPPVVTCQDFLASIKSYMEGNGGAAITSQSAQARIDLALNYIKTKLNSQAVTLTAFVGLGPVLGAVLRGIAGTAVRSASVQQPELNTPSPGGMVNSNSTTGNLMATYQDLFGDLAAFLMAVVSRITYTVTQRGLPLLTGVMWYLIIMGFPIAVMAAAFMGWRTMLTYTLSAMWVGSWLPATVLVKQIMNAYMDFAGDKAVDLADAAYIMLQGFVSMDLVKSVYTSADIAMIIAAMLIISIPIVTGVVYFVALRTASDALVKAFGIAAGSASQNVVSTVTGHATRTVDMAFAAATGGGTAALAASASAGPGPGPGGGPTGGGAAPVSSGPGPGGGGPTPVNSGVPVREGPKMISEPVYGDREIPGVIVSSEPISGIVPSASGEAGASGGSGKKGSSGTSPDTPPDNTKGNA